MLLYITRKIQVRLLDLERFDCKIHQDFQVTTFFTKIEVGFRKY